MSELRRQLSRRRGMVLIVVLSVLAVMAILGVSLITLNNLDRKISNNWLGEVQARLIARSGIEDGASRLREGHCLRSAFELNADWNFFGKDVDGKNPEARNTSLAQALRPSFAVRKADGSPEQMNLIKDDGSTMSVGYSGTMAGNQGMYSLEVKDLSSCLYVNDGVTQYKGNESTVSQNLKRILNVLGQTGQVNMKGLGDVVIANRPMKGYGSWQDFKTIVKRGSGWTDAQFSKLERYLTTASWVDKNVCNPVPLSTAVLSSYPIKYERGEEGLAVYRRGPGKNYRNVDRGLSQRLSWRPDCDGQTGPGGTTAQVFGYDELNPTFIEIVHRAPVNVNSAEEPVLVALLTNLRGFFLMEKKSSVPVNYGAPVMDYSAQNWLPKNFQFSVPKSNYTWEYMGHTYDTDQWPAQTKVVDFKDWKDQYGAANGSTQRETKEMPDHDSLGELWITPTLHMGTGETVTEGVSAANIAKEIIACRNRSGAYAGAPFAGPFKNWAQFYEFCDNLVTIKKDGTPGQSVIRDSRVTDPSEKRQAEQAIADMLKANFNPNFHANELNPDHNLFLMIDKTDLVVNSTEFCFLPTGYFSLTSVGRILRSGDGKGTGTTTLPQEVVAQARIRSVIRAHDLYRETNQRHFYLGDSTGANDPYTTNNGRTVECGPEPDNGPLVYGEHFNDQTFTQNQELDGYAGYESSKASITSGWGFESAGYLALPTKGGNGTVKPKNTLWKTAAGPKVDPCDQSVFGSYTPLIHSHFAWDDQLHDNESMRFQIGPSAEVYRMNVASSQVTGDKMLTQNITVYNPATCSATVIPVQVQFPSVEKATDFADPGADNLATDGGPMYGPYDPTDGTRFRVQRSFRMPLAVSTVPGGSTVSSEMTSNGVPKFGKVPPADLRVDGFYSERHSGLAYWLDEQVTPGTNAGSFSSQKGTVSFWFKPNFDPATTGKARSIMSVSRVHRKNFFYRNPSPFTLYFFPAQASSANPTAQYTGAFQSGSNANCPIPGRMSGCQGITQMSKASFVFNAGWSIFDGSGIDSEWMPLPTGTVALPAALREMDRYATTPSLNSKVNNTPESDKDGLRARRWTHVSVAWNLATGGDAKPMGIMVNGRIITGSNGTLSPSSYTNTYGNASAANPAERTRFALQSFLDHADPEDIRWYASGTEAPTDRIVANTLRLGEVSTHSFGMNNSMPRNFSSDGTYDELFLWSTVGSGELDSLTGGNVAKKKFLQGRYYVPAGIGGTDSVWTSPELTLRTGTDRDLTPPSGNVATGSVSAPVLPKGVNGTTDGTVGGNIRILGVAWTWFAEKYVAGQVGLTGGQMGMIPTMIDYRNADAPKELRQTKSCARIFVKTEGLKFPLNDPEGLSTDSYTATVDGDGRPLTLGSTDKFQYQVQFVVEGSTTNMLTPTVLLSSPMFDDVSFYYDGGQTRFLEYFQEASIE